MGTFHDEPVIVMKADIGNRSLGWDVLPPGSKSYTFDGKNYPGFDLAEKKTDAKGNRYRPITLPTGMENWASPSTSTASQLPKRPAATTKAAAARAVPTSSATWRNKSPARKSPSPSKPSSA